MSHVSYTEQVLRHFGGKERNELNNLLEDDADEGLNLNSNSPYVNLEQLCENMSNYGNNFSILSLNCQSLNGKFNDIVLTVETIHRESNFMFSVICLQESWLGRNSLDASNFMIPNYKKPFDVPASCSKHGGLLCYAHESFEAEFVKVYNTSHLFEGQVIEVSGRGIQPTTIANFYRPPKFNNNNHTLDEFMKEFSPIVEYLGKRNQNIIIASDLNIDLLKINEKEKYANFLDLMIEQGLFPKITMPTRFAKKSASLLDQIYIKNLKETLPTCHSGILVSPTSDHFGCFSIIEQTLTRENDPKFITITKTDDVSMINLSTAIDSINLMEIMNRNLSTDPNETYAVIESKIINISSYENRKI